MPKLLIKEGPGKGDLIELDGDRTTIGRDPDNKVRVADRAVSRFHAALEQDGNLCYVQDLDSHNGTLVNGERVQRRALFHLDEIRLGNVVLLYLGEEVSDIDALLQSREDGPEITQTVFLEEVGVQDVTSGNTQELIASNQRLLALTELSQAAAAVRSLPPLLDLLIDNIQRTLEPERVLPILQQEDGTLLPYMRSRSQFARGVEGIGISKATVDYCLRKGVAALSQSSPRGDASGALQISTVLCAPLRVGANVHGVIYCDRLSQGANYERADLQYMCLLAAQAAVAMENIRDHERVAARARNLELAVESQFDIVGQSPQIKRLYEFIRKAAPTEASVLICGESGTGKELVARAIHYHSRRNRGPFEVVNCAAMSPTLIESELFGHVKGAFTGAVVDRPGRFELADQGTIFLDEIGTLPLECQTKLLRVLEIHTVRRVGDVKDRTVDVRVIAATNQNLEQAQHRGQFREDLFYRLNVLRADLPPLRQREDDIDVLAEHFLSVFGGQCGRTIKGFDERTMHAFRLYRWPGNVRELKNVIERMVIMSEGDVLGPDLLPPELTKGPVARMLTPPMPVPDSQMMQPLQEVEKHYILQVLRSTKGNKKKAAEVLGLDRSTLYAKLKRFSQEG